MTRETKIGLLVGLAFIIVIGILLSDHLTSATDPPPAPLSPAGAIVRQTYATPGGTQTQMTPVVAPSHVMPQNQVPTPRDLQQPTQATAIVHVGGPSIQTQAAQNPQPSPPITFVSNTTPERAAVQAADPGADAVRNTLDQVAQQHGESVVNANPNPSRQAGSTASAGFKDYVALPGDSLSRIASRQMGSKDQINVDAIIRANPSLQQNPDLIIAGKTYRIPTNVPESTPAATPTAPAEVATATDYWYTVQDGDNLWRIATNQLGNPGAVSAIKELNKDLLKGGDTVRVNMKLRLPSKPIARAN